MSERRTGRRRSRLGRTVRRVGLVLAFLLVVEYLVLPQIAGARRSVSLVAHLNLWLVLLAVALEVGSLIAYAQLTRSVLPATSRPGLSTALRVDLSTLAVSHLVPGGAAAGTGVGFRLLEDHGVDGGDAGLALGIQGLGSALVLNVLLWAALVVSIPLHGFNPLYVSAAVVGAVLLSVFFALVLLLTKGEARAARAFRLVARRLPFLDEDAVHRMVHRLADRLRVLLADRGLLLAAGGWAAANWLLDAACLWVFVAAFGFRAPVEGVLVSYGLANVIGAIPVTPGGLGVIEAVLTPSLVGFGVPRAVAILAVVGYRLVNFWLPIPVGGLAYASLRAGRQRPARIMRELTAKAVIEAESPKEWAARHGLAVRAAHDAPSS